VQPHKDNCNRRSLAKFDQCDRAASTAADVRKMDRPGNLMYNHCPLSFVHCLSTIAPDLGNCAGNLLHRDNFTDNHVDLPRF